MNSRRLNGGRGTTHKRTKASKRRTGLPTKAQQAARVKILAEAGFNATPEEIEATERELRRG
jgi:hypothetical protein